MTSLSSTAAPYAAAILAVGTENPNEAETAIIKALGIDRAAHRHVAFAGWCRRTAAGEPADQIAHLRVPAMQSGELDAAMSAIGWLNRQTSERSQDGEVPPASVADALAILRRDAQRLTPQAARIAQMYVALHLDLDDLWRSALVRTLGQTAGKAPVPHPDALDRTLGRPGAWLTPAYFPEASDMRLWLAKVSDLAAAHTARPTVH